MDAISRRCDAMMRLLDEGTLDEQILPKERQDNGRQDHDSAFELLACCEH